MPRQRVKLLPDLKVDIPQDSAYCAFQAGSIVARVPYLQRNLRQLAVGDLCTDPRSQEAETMRRRIETLKSEINQGIVNTGRCQLEFPNTERLLRYINQATKDRQCDLAYQISRDLLTAVFADLAHEEFKSGMEKQLEAEARARAEAPQREKEMAAWREQVRRARVEKREEPPLPARWRMYYTLEEEEIPRKRGRPRGAAPMTRRAGAEAR